MKLLNTFVIARYCARSALGGFAGECGDALYINRQIDIDIDTLCTQGSLHNDGEVERQQPLVGGLVQPSSEPHRSHAL